MRESSYTPQRRSWFLPGALFSVAMAISSFARVEASQNVIVVLDDSGSMRQKMRTDTGRVERIQAAKEALSKVIQGLPGDAQLGILLLNNGGRGDRWLAPLGPLNPAAVLPKIAKIRADGGTPLGSQLKVAADALLQLRQKQMYGEYRLLVITDGEANDADLLNAYLPDILSRGFAMDVIGVDMAANHSLSDRAHSYRRADDARSFEKAIEEVFAESSSTSDDQGATDFANISDLPDELAKEALAALATPKNQSIAIHTLPPSVDGSPFPQATAPTPRPSSALDSLVGLLSALPCCFLVVIVFIVVVSISQGKNRKKRS